MKKAFPLPSWILSALGLVLFFSALFAYVFGSHGIVRVHPHTQILSLLYLSGYVAFFATHCPYVSAHPTEASAMDASLLKMIEESSLAGIIYDTNDTIVWVTQAMQALFPGLQSLYVGAPYSKVTRALGGYGTSIPRDVSPYTGLFFMPTTHEKKLGPALWVSLSESAVSSLTLVTFTDISVSKETELSPRTSEGHLQQLYRFSNGLCADDDSTLETFLILGVSPWIFLLVASYTLKNQQRILWRCIEARHQQTVFHAPFLPVRSSDPYSPVT